MATPKRKPAADSIKKLADRVDQLTSQPQCRKLLHWFIPGAPVSVTPGCLECAKVREQQDAWAKANPPGGRGEGAAPDHGRAEAE